MTLLGAPILQGEALDEALQIKVDELQKAINRLKLLRAHDALVLLKNSISIPKLLYLLRTSNGYNHPLLLQFDTILKSGLSTILNVDFDETQWIQETLPVNDGGLGIQLRTRWQHQHFWPLMRQRTASNSLFYHRHTTKCHTRIGSQSRRYGARFHLPTHLINKYSAFKRQGTLRW